MFLFYKRCISGVKALSDRYLKVFSMMVDVVACKNGKLLSFSHIGRLVFTTLKKMDCVFLIYSGPKRIFCPVGKHEWD